MSTFNVSEKYVQSGIKIASSESCRHMSLMNAKAQFEPTLRSLINTPCIQLKSYVGKWFAVLFISFIQWSWCNIWTLCEILIEFQYCLFWIFATHLINFGSLEYTIHVYTYAQFPNTKRISTAPVTATLVTTYCNTVRKRRTKVSSAHN
jgi:hypothetical protein